MANLFQLGLGQRRFLLALSLALVIPALILAAPTTNQKPEVKAWAESDQPSKVQRIHIVYGLPEGMHQFKDSKFFTVSVPDNPDLILTNMIFPPTTQTIAGLAAWSGQVELTAEVQSKSNRPLPSEMTIKAAWQICYDTGICLPPGSTQITITLPTSGNSSGPLAMDILWFVFLAFLGGIILNIMPCVLPVLSLKLMAIIEQRDYDFRTRLSHGLATSLGILVSLILLAAILVGLQSGGKMAGWGFQFQNIWYTMTLSLVVLVFALSLWDVWSLPMPSLTQKVQIRRPNQARSLGKDFLSGVLVVVLATPCTAPFLGSALGFALAAPAWTIFLVFFSIGLGLSLPFFVLSLVPNLARRLPKPGRWMAHLTEILGFALFGTFIWLLTVVYAQLPAAGFGGFLWLCFAITLGLRLYTLVLRGSWPKLAKLIAYILLITMVIGSGVWLVTIIQGANAEQKTTGRSKSLPSPWLEFDETAIATDLSQGRPVFIDFTAEWCLTCKINEAGALADATVVKAFDQANFRLYRGDYTNGDDRIDRWLMKYGRAGVPFYAILRPDGSSQVLPELLETGQLLGYINSFKAIRP